MNTNILIIVLTSLLSLSHISATREAEMKNLIAVKKGLRGHTLSISSRNVMLGEIVKELATKCNIRITVNEKALLSLTVNVSFEDVSLEKAIKRIIKAAGVKNHLTAYKNDSRGNPEIVEITLLGSTQKKTLTFSRELLSTKGDNENKVSVFTTKEGVINNAFSEKVDLFKKRYHWKDAETSEMAGYLLEIMPTAAREPGLKELTRSLDRMVTEGQEVDEEILYQAIESTVPPRVAPVMMKALKESVARYRSDEESETSRQSANELYRKFMQRSETTNQQKGR
jgi:hypothetical protein